MILGLPAVDVLGYVSMVLCMASYYFDDRSAHWRLGMALGSLGLGLYGWMNGTLVFVIFNAVWVMVALQRWRGRFARA